MYTKSILKEYQSHSICFNLFAKQQFCFVLSFFVRFFFYIFLFYFWFFVCLFFFLINTLLLFFFKISCFSIGMCILNQNHFSFTFSIILFYTPILYHLVVFLSLFSIDVARLKMSIKTLVRPVFLNGCKKLSWIRLKMAISCRFAWTFTNEVLFLLDVQIEMKRFW